MYSTAYMNFLSNLRSHVSKLNQTDSKDNQDHVYKKEDSEEEYAA